jgi:fructose-1,6-bisphosphatase/inositol monophosphatase family enzyme
LLDVFARAFDAQRDALARVLPDRRRERTDRPGQYLIDTVADAAVLPVLHAAGMRVLSEESGWTGPDDASITVVLDPIDGSTNCARQIPYWSISLCALDRDGLLAALVANGATGATYTAVRGEGAQLDGVPLQPATTEMLERAVVAINGFPPHRVPWRQFRALGSSALALCDVAAGHVDAFFDCLPDAHRPWDYLGGVLMCREAGAPVTDVGERSLDVADADVRRRLVASATPALLDLLLAEARR